MPKERGREREERTKLFISEIYFIAWIFKWVLLLCYLSFFVFVLFVCESWIAIGSGFLVGTLESRWYKINVCSVYRLLLFSSCRMKNVVIIHHHTRRHDCEDVSRVRRRPIVQRNRFSGQRFVFDAGSESEVVYFHLISFSHFALLSVFIFYSFYARPLWMYSKWIYRYIIMV